MAETKKPVTEKAAAKDVVVKAETAVPTAPVAVKVETAAVKNEEAPVVKKKPGRKPGSKTKKTAEKKAPAAKKAAEKSETVKHRAKNTITLEFNGQSYTEDSLIQSAKDVWVYDLGRDLKDFKSAELYVKPQDKAVYYVINGEVTGSFGL